LLKQQNENNILGLPVKESGIMSNELNSLLSNFQVYYQNLRGYTGILEETFFWFTCKVWRIIWFQLKIDMIADEYYIREVHLYIHLKIT
jgi:starvation-inducible DNA-binding protein